jgi:hypothetical protein
VTCVFDWRVGLGIRFKPTVQFGFLVVKYFGFPNINNRLVFYRNENRWVQFRFLPNNTELLLSIHSGIQHQAFTVPFEELDVHILRPASRLSPQILSPASCPQPLRSPLGYCNPPAGQPPTRMLAGKLHVADPLACVCACGVPARRLRRGGELLPWSFR